MNAAGLRVFSSWDFRTGGQLQYVAMCSGEAGKGGGLCSSRSTNTAHNSPSDWAGAWLREEAICKSETIYSRGMVVSYFRMEKQDKAKEIYVDNQSPSSLGKPSGFWMWGKKEWNRWSGDPESELSLEKFPLITPFQFNSKRTLQWLVALQENQELWACL